MKFQLYKTLFFLPVLILIGCASQPSYSKQKDLIQPLLQTEFKNIIDSAPENSRVGVDWCFDLRFEDGTVSSVSDWVQRQIEKLLVDSKKFVMVSRRYLSNLQREQELQASSLIDLFGNPVGSLTSLAFFQDFPEKMLFFSGSCSETEVSEQL